MLSLRQSPQMVCLTLLPYIKEISMTEEKVERKKKQQTFVEVKDFSILYTENRRWRVKPSQQANICKSMCLDVRELEKIHNYLFMINFNRVENNRQTIWSSSITIAHRRVFILYFIRVMSLHETVQKEFTLITLGIFTLQSLMP